MRAQKVWNRKRSARISTTYVKTSGGYDAKQTVRGLFALTSGQSVVGLIDEFPSRFVFKSFVAGERIHGISGELSAGIRGPPEVGRIQSRPTKAALCVHGASVVSKKPAGSEWRRSAARQRNQSIPLQPMPVAVTEARS